MTVESAFTSDHPDVLSVWDAWANKRGEFNRRCDEVEREFARRVMVMRSGFTGSRLVGLEPGGEIPDGLRLDTKGRPHMLVPAKRTARGKELDASWSKIRLSKPRYPGMPETAEAPAEGFSTHIFTPGYERVGDVVWCTWGTSAERVTGEVYDTGHQRRGSEFDPSMWQQRRLSEYHAMREAQEVSR